MAIDLMFVAGLIALVFGFWMQGAVLMVLAIALAQA